MRLHFKQGQDIIFVDKPSGLTTHASDPEKPGLVEEIQKSLNQKLWVTHRLDKTTTGAMVFATTKEKAEELRQAFLQHKVTKTYWFVTDRKSEMTESHCESFIEKSGGSFISRSTSEPNAWTEFVRVKRSPFFELWAAHPRSGKPHQIRLHAQQIGLPILGDTQHGGTPFPHLCLHSLSLKLPNEDTFTSPAPRFFERLGLLRDPELIQILSAIDKRQRLFDFLSQPEQALRLMHDEHPQLRIDKLGPVLWVYWYHDHNPTERDLERFDFLRHNLGVSLTVQRRQDRGQDPNAQMIWRLEEPPKTWQANEADLRFEFRENQGLSPGLFLDQRLNRTWVRQMSPDKDVLNLFSYTCGFSVAAAKGFAKKVTSVDLSKNFLDWGRTNFLLNGLDPDKAEWWSVDALQFLEGALRRGRKWDLIICDPPSFARNGKKVFRLKEDWPLLLDRLDQCLNPMGTVFFSNNFESINQHGWLKDLSRRFPHFEITPGLSDLDFESDKDLRLMKSFVLRRKSQLR